MISVRPDGGRSGARDSARRVPTVATALLLLGLIGLALPATARLAAAQPENTSGTTAAPDDDTTTDAGPASGDAAPTDAGTATPPADPLAEDLRAVSQYAGREIRDVRIEAIRFRTGDREPIREIDGFSTFIQSPDWLRERVLLRDGRLLRREAVEDDIRRLRSTGLFQTIRVYVTPDSSAAGGVNLAYALQSKPVREIRIGPLDETNRLATLSLAAVKSIMAIKEGGEFTEFKMNADVAALTEGRPNFADVRIRAQITQNPDGTFAEGIDVEVLVIENRYLSEIQFEGNEAKGDDDLLEVVRTQAQDGFYDPQLVARDADAIRRFYLLEGYYFCEVDWRPRTVDWEDPVTGRVSPRVVLVFDIQEGPNVDIGQVEFRGQELLIPAARDVIFTMPTEWWELYYSTIGLWVSDEQARRQPLTENARAYGDYNPAELVRDIDRLQSILRGNGWLDAEVELVHEDFSPDRSRVDLVYQLTPGPLYTVRHIEFEGDYDARLWIGNDIGDNSDGDYRNTLEEMRKRLTVLEDETYRKLAVEGDNTQQILGDSGRIQRFFQDFGYFNATVSVETTVVGPATVDLTYRITQGIERNPQTNERIHSGRVRIGRVTVTGNESTRETVVRRPLDGARPGRWYSRSAIEADTIRLIRLGWFSRPPQIGATINPRPTSHPFDSNRFVDLVVEVEEGETGTFNLGIGYSSERSVVGYLQLTKKNFDLFGWPHFTGAGQELSLNLQAGISSQTYSIDFQEPYFFATRFGYFTSFTYDNNQNLPSYKALEWIITTGFSYRLAPDLIARLTYRWNWFKAYDIEASASPAIQEASESKTYSSFRFGLEYDTRDDIFLPTQGFNLDTFMEVGGQYLGGNVNFWHYRAWASYTIPIRSGRDRRIRRLSGSDPAISLRVQFDVQSPFGPTDSVPILKRLSLGGPATPNAPAMRGFALEGVGPRDSGGNSLRGTARLVGNLEFRYPIQPGIIYGVVFIDAGQLVVGLDDLQSNNFNIAWGFGLRIRVPISPAPLALDFGFPLRMFDQDVEQLVSFSLGFNF